MSNIFCGTLENYNHVSYDGNETEQGIKLYIVEMSKFQDSVSSLIRFLLPAEMNRANRYHFSKDKSRFVICRMVLKFLLAKQTGLDVNKIVLDNDSNKKPYLSSHPSVFFNVTHAGDYAIIAIAKEPVGIDIEYINRKFEFSEIISYTLSNTEIDKLLNSDNKLHTFYTYWTRKEAIVKATGKGISDNLPHIPAMDGHHIVASNILDNFKEMKVLSFDLNEDYIVSIAYSGNAKHINKLLIYSIPLNFQEFINTK
jgi:4'-phosphopantetheinyl transferase